MSNDEVYEYARRRVEAKIGFYIHLAVYICINALLIGIDLAMASDALWFFWPLLWWGVGVVFHGLKVFEVFPVLGKDWEERKIKELMEKEKENKNKWQ